MPEIAQCKGRFRQVHKVLLKQKYVRVGEGVRYPDMIGGFADGLVDDSQGCIRSFFGQILIIPIRVFPRGGLVSDGQCLK